MGNAKKILTEKLKDMPFKFGAASLAALLGIAEGIIITSATILEGPKIGLAKKFDQVMNRKTFGDYYDEFYEALKNLKENNLAVTLYRLEKKGLIEKKKKGNYKLTLLGIKYYTKIKYKKPKRKWDGKWRIITFDIPEIMRKERYWIRTQLYLQEFKPLQKSVFIGKWPMDEDLFKEISLKKMNNFIRIMTVREIDDESYMSLA